MNKITGVIVAAIIVFAGFMAVKTNNDTEAASPQVSYSTVQSAVQSGAKFYDVRTAQEYGAGRFAAAENWSLQDMQAGKFPDVDKSTKIYVHCQSGNRSAQATTLLKNAGFTNVIDLGGLADVQRIGGILR